MSIISVFLMVLGGVCIWVSSRNSSQQVRQIGIGLLLAGLAMILLSRFDIPLFPE